METGRLIGRYNECKRLDLCVKEEKAQLVVVYGRRRVGKTFLIDEYFKNGFAFHLNDSNTEQDNIYETCDAILKQKYKMICVNESKVEHFEETRTRINRAFEQILPDKCSFEI